MLQPVSHGLVQQSACSTCWQGKALQEWETFQPVAAALRGRDVALPHHSRPAEPSAPAAGTWGRQCPLWTRRQLPQDSGGWTTVTRNRLNYPRVGGEGKIKGINPQKNGQYLKNKEYIFAMIVSQENAEIHFCLAHSAVPHLTHKYD